MIWEYLIGSEKDFEGAPDWCTHVSGGGLSVAGSAWEEGSVARTGKRYQWIGGEREQFYDNAEDIKLNIVAQRRKRKSKQWDGVGLPPVGCECEALIPYRGELEKQWRKVKVIFSGDELDALGEFIVVDLENTRPCWTDVFRPLRSEHEVKVDGFKLDLLNVISMIGNQFGGIGITSDGIEAISQELIMLGYEKTK